MKRYLFLLYEGSKCPPNDLLSIDNYSYIKITLTLALKEYNIGSDYDHLVRTYIHFTLKH